jgi:hypothetical protein
LNDAPVMVALSDVTTPEDESLGVPLSATDSDGDPVTFTAVSSDAVNISTDISGSLLTLTPALNFNGSATISVTANDGTEDSDIETFTLTVSPVNDPPMSFSLLTPADNDTIVLVDDNDLLDDLIFSWTESENVDGDTIEYTIFTDNFLSDSILVGENTQWTISVQTIFDAMAENQISNYSLTWYVKAHDMELSVQSTQTFTFNIDATEMLSIDNGDLVPESFSLHQNYPNPFNPVTNIGYDISEKTVVHIEIYDITGKLVKIFNEGLQEPGRYTLNWNASDISGRNLSGGMYIYRINTENFSKTRKMTLLK